MPRPFKFLLPLAGLFLALAAAALIVMNRRAEAPNPYADLSLPPFTLTTQDRGTISRDDLAGRVTIVDFIFTNCPLACPTLTGTMAGLADALRGTEVRFLSVSVDPEHDTAERLREYADSTGADTTRWTFATGDPAVLRAIVTDGLKFALQPDPRTQISLPGGVTMANIVHPTWHVLIGPDLRVHGIYESNSPEAIERLERDARALAAR